MLMPAQPVSTHLAITRQHLTAKPIFTYFILFLINFAFDLIWTFLEVNFKKTYFEIKMGHPQISAIHVKQICQNVCAT